MKPRRLRRTSTPSLETWLGSADPSVWTTAAERARVGVLLAAGGHEARTELLDLGARCLPVVDVGAVHLDAAPAPFRPLRGAPLSRATVVVVASVVASRRAVAVDGWVQAEGYPLSGRGWVVRASDAITTRYGGELAAVWQFGPSALLTVAR